MIVGLFITALTDRPASFKAAGHRDNLQTKTGAQGSYSYTHDPTHLLARQTFSATTYKQKEIEGNCLLPTPDLLTKK